MIKDGTIEFILKFKAPRPWCLLRTVPPRSWQ